MKDMNRDQVARHLFDIMNGGRKPLLTSGDYYLAGNIEWARMTPEQREKRALDNLWVWYVEQGFDAGYLRIADEIVSKGYKP